MAQIEQRKVKVVYCVDTGSEVDVKLQKELAKHLAPLRRTEAIQELSVAAGAGNEEITQKVGEAEVALLLVSADLMNADDPRLLNEVLKRHAAKKLRVIPVLIREYDWRSENFGGLTPLPRNAKPVTKWSDHDSAWVEVVDGLRTVVYELAKQPQIEEAQGTSSTSVQPVRTGQALPKQL